MTTNDQQLPKKWLKLVVLSIDNNRVIACFRIYKCHFARKVCLLYTSQCPWACIIPIKYKIFWEDKTHTCCVGHKKTDQIFPKLQPVVVVCTCCGRSSISSWQSSAQKTTEIVEFQGEILMAIFCLSTWIHYILEIFWHRKKMKIHVCRSATLLLFFKNVLT